MSSTPSVLWDRLCYELFPSNTYHFNSGGDPEAIPDLTYQQLRDFYAEHYHPSNAIFLTFGDIPAADHQRVFRVGRIAAVRRPGPSGRGRARGRVQLSHDLRRIPMRWTLKKTSSIKRT